MIIKDINEVVDSLGKITNLEISKKGVIKLTFNKNSTIEITPYFINPENNEIHYRLDYLSSKQNKEIDKLKYKIQELQSKINNIKDYKEEKEDVINYIEEHFIVEE